MSFMMGRMTYTEPEYETRQLVRESNIGTDLSTLLAEINSCPTMDKLGSDHRTLRPPLFRPRFGCHPATVDGVQIAHLAHRVQIVPPSVFRMEECRICTSATGRIRWSIHARETLPPMPYPTKIAISVFVLFSAISNSFASPSSALDYPSIWECDTSRWNWYCDKADKPETPPEEEAPEKPEAKPPKKIKHISELESLEEVRKYREQLLWEATKNPNAETVARYLEAQKWMSDKSSTFADVGQRVVWTSPTLDSTIKQPTTSYALSVKRDEDKANRQRSLSEIAKDNGIFFFFRSDCQYCHAMAPLVKHLEAKYGMEIVPVSLDGRGLTQFPNPRPNIGAATQLNVTTVPALFLVSNKGVIQPLSFGAISFDEMVERIYVLTQTKPGDRY